MFKNVICGLSLLGSVCAYGQTVSGFENVISVVDSAYNGSDLNHGKISGAGHFWNTYNKTWGSWTGFSISSKTDTVKADWSNQYSSISGMGANSSLSYAVAYSNAYVTFTESMNGDSVVGVSLNNSTYAYKTIRDGGAFSKKFGGTSGNDTDYFKVVLTGMLHGNKTGEVVFYLADYRFTDNLKDYIVKDWTWVDLTSLGSIDELELYFESTDKGQWGINTPTYVCLDSLVYKNSGSKFRPVATNDQFLTAFDGVNDAYSVLANDKDPDGTLKASNLKLLNSFAQGTTTIEADGKIKMAPNSSAYGWDTCDYIITDADFLADTAQFRLLINDEPEAKDDEFIVLSADSATIEILKNDIDEATDSLKVTIRKQPNKGTAYISTDNQLVYKPNGTLGNDTLRYQIEDEYGLIDSAEVHLILDLTFSVAQENSAISFSVYPNPANDFIHIDLEQGAKVNYSLTDLSGRTTKFGIISDSEVLLVSDLPKGVYILRLNDGMSEVQQKILIQ
ncbi:MAG: hypothetical protein CL840_14680 [Crocinitomicaceae bacterium]|nr:hypothetical protein [Crocinitomicaceae bacterium]|tara:strand:+ start:14497 stop:16014 length:1518 start_codon:yes stop_codon:yes gene_type:complete